MSIDTHVTCCTRQRLAFTVWDMLFGLGVSILLCHAKIDDMDDIGGFRARAANEEVIWLDIAVNEILLVDGLDAGKLLGLSQ